jgi:acyl-CoA synthetase (AMP-forming)/AMP-acid ligase II
LADHAPTPQIMPELLKYAVERFGAAPAIDMASGVRTYRDIAAGVERLTKGLLAAGIGKGTRVGVLAGNSPFWVEALFACAQIGAIMVPISTLAAPPELAQILRHSDTHILLATRRYLNRDYADLIARALPALANTAGAGGLRLAEAPFLRSIWLDEADGVAWASPLQELIDRGAADPALDSDFLKQIESEVTPSDDAVIIYTSGSTAAPKAVLHAQGPMVRQARNLIDAQIERPGERVLLQMPLFWVGGMNMLLEFFYTGACLVLADGVSTRVLADTLRDRGAHVLHAWWPQRNSVRALMQAEGLDISDIRNLREERMPDGAPKPPDLIPNSLGMTESFGPHGIAKLGSTLPEHRRGAFAPSSGGFERRVADPETGAILAPGQLGELQIRGGSLMRGYYKRERADTFTPDGFFATSDLVRIEPDGYMYFEGRSGDMIKSKGANISRLEVEAALRKVSGVAEPIVCALPDAEAGEIVAAAVTAKMDATVTEAEIKAALRDLIASYKIPAHIIIIDAADILYTPSGKIRLFDMRKLIAQRLGRTPRPSIESTI